MKSQAYGNRSRGDRMVTSFAKAALLAALMAFGTLATDFPATAGGGSAAVVAAAQTANAGLAACGSNRGKALYDCVSDVLLRLSNDTNRQGIIDARNSLRAAASQLRAAVTKVQALSAITQCRAAVAGFIQQIRSSGQETTGLNAIAGVLSRAAALIQSKG
jgi:hypothetical protein